MTAETPDNTAIAPVWSVLWLVAVSLAGLLLLIIGLVSGPPTREALVAAEHVGPLTGYHTELISYSGRRSRGTYRTQRIPLTVPGVGMLIVSPARGLWVDGIDSLRPDQTVRFLIEPRRRLVYEATSRGRSLLAYEDTARNRRDRSRGVMLTGLFCLCVAGLHAFNLCKPA